MPVPYAEALFRVASEDTKADALKTWSSLVDDMGAVASDPDMRRVLADPRVTGDQVYSVFVAALGSEPNTHAQNFVRTLIDNDRLGVMPEIAMQFGLLVDAKQGSAEAKITSAFPMNDADVADLVGALEKKFRHQAQACGRRRCSVDRRRARRGRRPRARHVGALATRCHEGRT